MKIAPFLLTVLYFITGVLLAGDIGSLFRHPFNHIVTIIIGFMTGWFARPVYHYLDELINN